MLQKRGSKSHLTEIMQVIMEPLIENLSRQEQCLPPLRRWPFFKIARQKARLVFGMYFCSPKSMSAFTACI